MNFRTVAAAAAILMSSMAAQASTITVQGITWDPDSIVPMDFQANGAPAYQWFQTSAAFNPTSAFAFNAANLSALEGTYLAGAANVSQLNGITSASTFAPGRELTYIFGGIKITSVTSTFIPALNQTLVNFGFDVSESYFRVYSDSSLDYTTPTVSGLLADQVKAANTDFGTPFLQGVFNTFGVNTGLLTTNGVFSGTAAGLISITGGAAGTNFDTNTIGIPGGGLADLSFTGSTQVNNGSRISEVGSTDFQGDSRAIPEPSSLALVGLALAGAGFAFNRRKSVK